MKDEQEMKSVVLGGGVSARVMKKPAFRMIGGNGWKRNRPSEELQHGKIDIRIRTVRELVNNNRGGSWAPMGSQRRKVPNEPWQGRKGVEKWGG